MSAESIAATAAQCTERTQRQYAKTGGFRNQCTERWRTRRGLAEIRGDGVEVERVDLAVEVEVAVEPGLSRAVEVSRQRGEVQRGHRAIEVRVAGVGVADEDGGGVNGL